MTYRILEGIPHTGGVRLQWQPEACVETPDKSRAAPGAAFVNMTCSCRWLQKNTF